MDEEVSEAPRGEPAKPVEPAATLIATPQHNWLGEGARLAFFRAPRWPALNSTPWTLAALLLLGYVVTSVWERAALEGHPDFFWRGLLGGWPATALNAWLCWIIARSFRPAPAGDAGLAKLFALLCATYAVFGMFLGAVFAVLRHVVSAPENWPLKARWIAWLAPLIWIGLAQIRLLWWAGKGWPVRAAILLLTPATLAISGWLAPVQFWWPAPSADAHSYKGLPLTQQVVDAQPRLLAEALAGLQPQRPGKVDLYALTYAPYASQDVFMRESAAVTKTMGERFGAAGRMVQLVVNPASSTTLPWATPANLQRSIQRMAALMDRDEDVLFLHLTSHGGADGVLAVDTWPLQSEPVRPQMLKAWLDEAGVRWRVVSVSACFSGSWIAPLAGDGTLVMTAADADHTSYGCGSKSPLTFFGQAMYVDALPGAGSFEEAHAQARRLIERREKVAGKTDGFSNPQISEGRGIAAQLQRLYGEGRQRDQTQDQTPR